MTCMCDFGTEIQMESRTKTDFRTARVGVAKN